MKGFRLQQLRVEDFLGQGDLVLMPGGRDQLLRGACGSGKTAVRQAFLWLLLQEAAPRWSAVEAVVRTDRGSLHLRRDFGYAVDGVRCSLEHYRRQLEKLLEPWQLQILLSWDSLLKNPLLWQPLLRDLLGREAAAGKSALQEALEADVHAQAQKLRGRPADVAAEKARIRAARQRLAGLSLGRIFPGYGFHRQPWGWEVSWRGIPWARQSLSRQILTGLAIRQVLCDWWQAEVPLFLDDGALLTDLPAVNSQLILLLAAPCKLTMEERR